MPWEKVECASMAVIVQKHCKCGNSCTIDYRCCRGHTECVETESATNVSTPPVLNSKGTRQGKRGVQAVIQLRGVDWRGLGAPIGEALSRPLTNSRY